MITANKDAGGESTEGKIMAKKKGSFSSIFMHADGVDKLLMTIGFLGAVGEGFAMPTMLFVTSHVMNNVGSFTPSSAQNLTHNINKLAVILCYLAICQWIAGFLEGYCWTRTAERQASALRTRYLKAVLRQEVAYFDFHVTSTAEIIASVSSDSLIIQEVISEKVPVFVMNLSSFIGGYMTSFLLLWRLAVVAFPFVILMVVPSLMFGRNLMAIARLIRKEYGKAGGIVEQAISSIRTVYSFVGETKTVSEYSNALERPFKLGIQQGLSKGIAIGVSSSWVFAIWSFMSYYGSKLIINHGAKGGSVYAVGTILLGINGYPRKKLRK